MRPAVKKVPTVQLRSDVVVRVSRYAAHPIIIGDDTTASMRISGVFHTGDAQGFVTTVVSYLPLRAQRAPTARSASRPGNSRAPGDAVAEDSERAFRFGRLFSGIGGGFCGGRVCSYMNPAS